MGVRGHGRLFEGLHPSAQWRDVREVRLFWLRVFFLFLGAHLLVLLLFSLSCSFGCQVSSRDGCDQTDAGHPDGDEALEGEVFPLVFLDHEDRRNFSSKRRNAR